MLLGHGFPGCDYISHPPLFLGGASGIWAEVMIITSKFNKPSDLSFTHFIFPICWLDIDPEGELRSHRLNMAEPPLA